MAGTALVTGSAGFIGFHTCRRLLAAYPNFTIAQFRSAMVFSPEFLERIGTQLRALGVPER